MVRTQIYLTAAEREAVARIAVRTSRSQSEVIRAAVDRLIDDDRPGDRLRLLQEARGSWKDRVDLPDFTALRRELDRTAAP